MEIETVLIVDDDTNLRFITQMCLEDVGMLQVTAAESGAQALELVAQQKFDLILLDVMMPGMDGPQTFVRLHELMTTPPPIIFLTAKIQPQEVDSYLKLGAVGIITKPFDPMTLTDEIKRILHEHAAASGKP